MSIKVNIRPLIYRPEGESRHATPAEVCDTCSDFDAGRLVPVAFCPAALAKSDELYAFIRGRGPRPSWLEGAVTLDLE